VRRPPMKWSAIAESLRKTAIVLWQSTTNHKSAYDFLPPSVVLECFLIGRSRVEISARRPAFLSLFVVFLSPSKQIPDSTLNYETTASFQIIFHSSFTYHHLLRHYIVLVTNRTSLNKLNKINFLPPHRIY
jgi:hypothetical protein